MTRQTAIERRVVELMEGIRSCDAWVHKVALVRAFQARERRLALHAAARKVKEEWGIKSPRFGVGDSIRILRAMARRAR